MVQVENYERPAWFLSIVGAALLMVTGVMFAIPFDKNQNIAVGLPLLIASFMFMIWNVFHIMSITKTGTDIEGVMRIFEIILLFMGALVLVIGAILILAATAGGGACLLACGILWFIAVALFWTVGMIIGNKFSGSELIHYILVVSSILFIMIAFIIVYVGASGIGACITLIIGAAIWIVLALMKLGCIGS